MGNINISDLRPAGADLFLDSESYLNDLTEGEMMNTLGGAFSVLVCFNEGRLRSVGFCKWDGVIGPVQNKLFVRDFYVH